MTMKTILVLGAGKCAGSLIDYLLEHSTANKWKVRVADKIKAKAEEYIQGHKNGEAVAFDANVQKQLDSLIKKSALTLSLLPPIFQLAVAESCVRYGKSLISASPMPKGIMALEGTAHKKKSMLLMECGLAPGIDHMIAKQGIDLIQKRGGVVQSLRSYTGTLVPVNEGVDDNPWGFRLTENAAAMMHAGKEVARCLIDGQPQYINHGSTFSRADEVYVSGIGEMDVYPCGDAIYYQEIFGLQDAGTVVLGKLRPKGFCDAWGALAKIGLTDGHYRMKGSEHMSMRDFLAAFLPYSPQRPLEEVFCEYLGIDQEGGAMQKLKWLGLFDEQAVGIRDATPAQVLRRVLEKKWALLDGSNDVVVMQHQIGYEIRGEETSFTASMVYERREGGRTAMADTVGLPMGIAAKLYMQKIINIKGVITPAAEEIYVPMVEELSEYGINFTFDEEVGLEKATGEY